jgi:RecA-family ATPase
MNARSAPSPDLLAAALEYANKGIPVFPCDPASKRPLTLHGFRNASCEPATVSAWWRDQPDAMIGMPTGVASGVWVLDVDDPARFEASAPHLTATRKVITGKGYHLHFSYDGGTPVGNAQRNAKRGWPFLDLPGAEVRGEGGYVIMPPSPHPSGKRYTWADQSPATAAPEELLKIVSRRTKIVIDPSLDTRATIPGKEASTDSLYGIKALDGECAAILMASEGEQECTLNEAALKIGGLVAGGELRLATATARLVAAGLAMVSHDGRNPWTLRAIASKVERGLADGSTRPRSAPFSRSGGEATATSVYYESGGSNRHQTQHTDDGDFETLDWSALSIALPEPKRFIIPNFAPAGEVTMLYGAGSSGKSLLIQQLATALAVGVPTLGLFMGQAPTIYLTCEDDAAQLHWRQHQICKASGVDMDQLAGKFWSASLRGRLNNALGTFDKQGGFTPSLTYRRLSQLVRRTGAKLVGLDNVAYLFSGNENVCGEVTQFVNALNRLADETGAAIILLGHPNKAGDSYSGSTAWLNAVRSQIALEHDAATDMRTLTVGKANYAQKGEVIRFAWLDWAFVAEADIPPAVGKELAQTLKSNNEDAGFLRCLAVLTQQRRNVSHHPGSNYAPKMFAGMIEAKGIKQKGFEAAFERLMHARRIEIDAPLWSGADRHPKRGIRLVEGAA